MLGITWDDSKPKPRRSAAAVVLALSLAAGSTGTAQASTPPAEASTPVQVIVRRTPGSGSAAEHAVKSLGGEVRRQLGIIDSFSAVIPSSAQGRLRAMAGVDNVVRDAPVQMHATTFNAYSDPGSTYTAQVRAGVHDLRRSGLTGKGVTVALIDTGVVPVNGLATPGKIIYGPDLSFESQASNLRNLDTYGHGTHMAGIIAGRDNDAVAPYTDTNKFTGVAPDARILSIKIGDSEGATDVSTMIAAIDWVVTHRWDNGMDVRVMNLSFGTDSALGYLYDPIANAVETAWHRGIVVVAAAGNRGNTSAKLDNPARDPYIVSVGSVTNVGTSRQIKLLGKCMDADRSVPLNNGTKVILWDCNGNLNQQWNVNANGSVTNVESGLCLDVYNVQAWNGSPLQLWECHGGANQTWANNFATSATSTLVGKHSGKCLDVPYANPINGNRLQIYTCNGTAAQSATYTMGDTIPTYSSAGDGIRNPDFVAPGHSIASLRAPGSYVDQTYVSAVTGERFFRGSGTSQSAAFVSGVAALMFELRPWATPDDIKAQLKSMTVKLRGVSDKLQGAGMLNVSGLRTTGIPQAPAQSHQRSVGTGKLQASRGSMRLTMDGVTLTGEKDIFGNAVDTAALARKRGWGENTWYGGRWSNSDWTGYGWSGNTWTGNTWTGKTWSGKTWSGTTYSGNTWTGKTWSGLTWAGNTWFGKTWSGNTWAGSDWSNTFWK